MLGPLEAADAVAPAGVLERRHLVQGTLAGPLETARRERAPVGPLADSDRDARDALEPARLPVVGHGAEEPAGVRVPRPGEERAGGTLLDDPARVHDGDAIGERADDREVVGDVDDRDAALPAQAVDLLEDARLRDHVEPGRRLVEDDEPRLADERDGDRDPLLLTARELVRVPPREGMVGGEVDGGERARPPRRRRASFACAFTMSPMRASTRSAGLSASPGSWAT